jgi:hypothetical protein
LAGGITALYSLISLAALRVAIRSARMARQSADASIATVRAWLDIHTLMFIYSLTDAHQPAAPEILAKCGKSGQDRGQSSGVTVEFFFDDPAADKQFSGCPATSLIRNPLTVAGPPGEPFTFPIGRDLAAKFAQLNGAPDRSLSIYAHGCVRYCEVMTNLQRLTEFRVRYYGGRATQCATIPT